MEIRECLCGCGNTFEVNKSSKRKYINGGHFNRGKSKLRGKTYEEIYGKERAKEKKKHITLTRTGKKLNRKKPSYKKGIKYKEIYGEQKTKEIKQKIINANIKNGLYWTKEKIVEAYKNLPNIRKSELRYYRRKKLISDTNTIRKYFGSLDNLAKISNKLFLKPIYNFGFSIGQNETKILNIIEKQNNIKLLRQYQVGKYFIDGYDTKNNIAYEIDEDYHKNNYLNDIRREEKIKEITNCKIVRLNEREFISNIKNKNIYNFIKR